MPKEALANIGDILGRCKKLETLSLKGCPVEEADHYREWIIFRCKKLRSLDFDRVKEAVSGMRDCSAIETCYDPDDRLLDTGPATSERAVCHIRRNADCARNGVLRSSCFQLSCISTVFGRGKW